MQISPKKSDASHPRSIARSSERERLYSRYAKKLTANADLNRAVVSFQANRNVPFYRWLKYREGFSSELVRYLLNRFEYPTKTVRRVLDPFAGAGTTLTTATKAGWKAVGIELLPVGVAAIKARLSADKVNIQYFEDEMGKLEKWNFRNGSSYNFPHVNITNDAFSQETELAISSFIAFLETIDDSNVRFLFWFACVSILEDVSFTRKDGQYLRWDARSGRKLKAVFNKGKIYSFENAIREKIADMLEDLANRNGGTFSKNARVIEGSCLTELPRLRDNSFDLILTSPPYCNRYDYTRTYALELAFLGCDNEAIKSLRQTLLSATVENKSKRDQLAMQYKKQGRTAFFEYAVQCFEQQAALHEVLGILKKARDAGELNNSNIPNLVENYFFETNIVIHEFARILAAGGHVAMVNDNVQYQGEEVPVDLILSDFASKAGLNVDSIWVLARGKGNSSQQMGTHGRTEIRKCVYVWSKP